MQHLLHSIVKIIPLFISTLILWYILNYTSPPTSWPTASSLQILSIFIPLLFFFLSLTYLFLHSLKYSFIIAIGLEVIAFFQAQRTLNWPTTLLTILLTSLLILFIKRSSHLTKRFNIPKLTRL